MAVIIDPSPSPTSIARQGFENGLQAGLFPAGTPSLVGDPGRPGMLRSALHSSTHKAGADWVKMELGVGKYGSQPGVLGFLGKWAGRGFVGYSAYEGYKQGGVMGAAVGAGTHLAGTYAAGAGLRFLGITGGTFSAVAAPLALGGAMVASAASYATGVSPLQFLARPAVREHMRKHVKLEMGRPVVDQFGTMSTMRQRSISAIQRSKLNGRSALGNEAMMGYQPYFR